MSGKSLGVPVTSITMSSLEDSLSSSPFFVIRPIRKSHDEEARELANERHEERKRQHIINSRKGREPWQQNQ